MQQVAKAIANLQKRGVREVAQLVRREGWYVEPHWMPTEQATALLNILEQVAPARRRVGVNNMLRSEQIPEEQIAALREQNMTASGDGGQTTIDETKYYRALRGALVAAQAIERAALETLAAARAESIRVLLVDELGADPNRLELLEPAAVEKSSDERWVRLELEITARD